MVFQYVPLTMSLSGQNWIREGCLLGLSYREIEAAKEKRHTQVFMSMYLIQLVLYFMDISSKHKSCRSVFLQIAKKVHKCVLILTVSQSSSLIWNTVFHTFWVFATEDKVHCKGQSESEINAVYSQSRMPKLSYCKCHFHVKQGRLSQRNRGGKAVSPQNTSTWKGYCKCLWGLSRRL